MRAGLAFGLVLSCAGLAACDVADEVSLHNATARTVGIERADYIWQWRTLPVKPAASASRYIGGSELRLMRDGCSVRYLLPHMGLNYPWYTSQGADRSYTYPVEIQLEPDGILLLMPSGSKAIMPREVLQRQQAHGYPVQPASKDCP